jgi:hypothetical protein
VPIIPDVVNDFGNGELEFKFEGLKVGVTFELREAINNVPLRILF